MKAGICSWLLVLTASGGICKSRCFILRFNPANFAFIFLWIWWLRHIILAKFVNFLWSLDDVGLFSFADSLCNFLDSIYLFACLIHQCLSSIKNDLIFFHTQFSNRNVPKHLILIAGSKNPLIVIVCLNLFFGQITQAYYPTLNRNSLMVVQRLPFRNSNVYGWEFIAFFDEVSIFMLFLLLKSWAQSAMSVNWLERLGQHSRHALSFFHIILLMLTRSHFIIVSDAFLRWSTRRGVNRINSTYRLRTSEW